MIGIALFAHYTPWCMWCSTARAAGLLIALQRHRRISGDDADRVNSAHLFLSLSSLIARRTVSTEQPR